MVDLASLRSAYVRLSAAKSALDETNRNQTTIKEGLENITIKGMAQKPPYSLTLLDSVQEEVLAAERNQKNISLTIELLLRQNTAHKEQLEVAGKENRQIREKLSGPAKDMVKKLRWRLEGNQIRLAHLRVILKAKESEIQRLELERNLADLQIESLVKQSNRIAANIAYDEEDLKHQVSVIHQKKAEVAKDTERLEAEQKQVDRKWLNAQHDFEKTADEGKRILAEAYLKSRAEWRKTYQVALDLNLKINLLLDRQILAWQKRYDLIRGKTSLDKLKEMKTEIDKEVSNLEQTLQIQQNYLVSLQKQMSAIEARFKEEGLSEAILKHLTEQLTAMRRRLERRLEYQSVILLTDQIEKRLLKEITDGLGKSTLTDRISTIKDDIVDFWNIEIWTADNKPVTLKKVAIALVILILGMVVANYMLSLIRRRFLLKSQFKETTASVVHKVLSYTAYLLVALFALRMVNIPLTAFAFLGGAVAIGIGFGAQNLINNFISGFMILGERPINIGDLIEVNGVLGMVEEIGARCTRVRTGENIHILVPNSTFLERNITNWTLSDQTIRANIVVGVSYGSPVRKVREKLIEAVRNVDRVLKQPEPFVLFSDFGDNALIFHIYFWVGIKRVIERRQIESDVRFEIDDLFAKEGIVIAFPQRDIHLDSDAPLRVSIQNRSDE